MKKILYLMILTFLLSCSNDDNTHFIGSNDSSPTIQKWNLIFYSFPAVGSFQPNDVIWTLDGDDTLTIENSVSNTYPFLIPSGTYHYTLENNLLNVRTVGLVYKFDYSLSSNDTILELFFDIFPEILDDEKTYRFEKI